MTKPQIVFQSIAGTILSVFCLALCLQKYNAAMLPPPALYDAPHMLTLAFVGFVLFGNMLFGPYRPNMLVGPYKARGAS
jgi:hypothetical protein